MFVASAAYSHCGDLLASAVNITGAAIIVPQRVVPESHPMQRVIEVVREQAADQTLALVGALIGDESLHLLRRRQQADHVQINPAGIRAIADGRDRLDLMGRKVRLQEKVDRVGILGAGRNCRAAGREIVRLQAGQS